MISDAREYLQSQASEVNRLFAIPENKIAGLTPKMVASIANLTVAASGDAVDGNHVGMSAAAAISTNECYPFIFEDKELVKDILESDIKSIPTESLKVPHPHVLIEIPEPVPFPDGSGDVWDVAYICAEEATVSNAKRLPNSIQEVAEVSRGENTHQEYAWVCMAFDSRNKFKANYLWFFPNRWEYLTEDESKIPGDDPAIKKADAIISKSIMQLIKLIFFITSPSASVRTEHRGKPSHKAPPAVKARFPTTNTVTLSKEHVNYEYDNEGDNSGRYTVRFRVRGHFAVYSKGVLAGRVIWRRPHWKGPDVAAQVERKYLVC